MRLCVAQTRPFTGEIARTIEAHLSLINVATSNNSDLILFPELSITGYEPTLANQLATTPDDHRLDVFQRLSNTHTITIGIGLPTRAPAGIHISLIIFQPHTARQVYSKQYLHADEEPFFVAGQPFTDFTVDNKAIALAICYELFVPQHAQDAANRGANLYMASVVKSVNGIGKALTRLAEIARTYAMPVLMANAVGQADGEECAGKSSVWNAAGVLIGQLTSTDEGLLLFDTDTQEVIAVTLPSASM
ncbi:MULTISPECIES: carbon-nitrogen hydrolase family protein [unclassified Spirosoma]|uniref:carbon-nitrogen hydrolase family protein n=1 Tax=unclassified Spirosoma TaxID=2621999 RepID=UPI00095DDA44|nr:MULTISPECIES: carbon-nitrogen hydrolase family protein [unclassified Spirosoma]MBN8820725.1 carbon-nitrogen hydrolase family protein [Spirosoma sp.]OJW79440.1 MAG: carbon-nitrogen hydrolase family protein [Spirosoma sp. 48-14]